jgi:hypothetical protein
LNLRWYFCWIGKDHFISSLLFVLLLRGLWPDLALFVLCLVRQNWFRSLQSLFYFRLLLLVRVHLETEYLWDELLALEVGLEVRVCLNQPDFTINRRWGKEVPKYAPSASADFFFGE